jgi:hypothetical protein
MLTSMMFVGTLGEELDALLEIVPLRLLVWFVLVAGLVWLLAVAIPLGIRIAWQLGLDPRRRLAIVRTLARVLAPFVGLLGIAEPFFTRAPALALIGLFALAGLAMLASPMGVRNLAAGLGLLLRARPRPGDLIRIGELEGTVDDIGLMRVSLRTREGGITMVPTADFERLPVTIGSHGAAVPVEIDVELAQPLDDAALERLRRALWFSPFRRAGTDVHLVRDPSGGRLHLAIDTWAPRASVELERHVRNLLESTRPGRDGLASTHPGQDGLRRTSELPETHEREAVEEEDHP